MAAIKISIFAAVFCVVAYGHNIVIPQTSKKAGSQSCRYEFVVPDTQGMCNGVDPALENKIDQVKADLDRSRIQYVSQNSIFQEQLAKVQTTANSYGSQMNDLHNELMKLQNQMGAFPAPAVSNELRRSVHSTKDYLNQALRSLENKMYNISYQAQKDAIEQSKLNAAMEMQVRIQEEKSRRTEEKVMELLKSVMALRQNPSSGGGGGSVNPALLSQVEKKLKYFEEQIKLYDQMQVQELSTLQMKSNGLALKVSNQSHQINDLSVESQALMYQIQGTLAKANAVTNDLKRFQTSSTPRIDSLEHELNVIKGATETLKKNLDKVATNAMGASVLSKKEKYDIHNLETSIDLLSLRITDIVHKLSNQSSTIKVLAGDLNSLSTTLNPNQLGILNRAMQALQNTGSLGSVTKSDLQQVEKEIKELNKLVDGLKTQNGKASVPTTKSTGFHIPTMPPKAHTTAKAPPGFHVPTMPVKKTGKPLALKFPSTPSNVHTTAKSTPGMKTPGFHVPTVPMKNTVKPFAPKLPSTPSNVPTTAKSPPGMKTPGFHVPVLPVKKTVKPLALKFPSTPSNVPTTAKSPPGMKTPAFNVPTLPLNNNVPLVPKLPAKTPTTKSSKTPTTVRPPPGFHVPTLPGNGPLIPKLPVKTPTTVKAPPGLLIPKLP